MSALERRLQLLLDQERYERLAARAKSEECSVAAVIREAIDQLFANQGVEDSAAAAAALLALPLPEQAGEGPEELKRAYAAESDPERLMV
jgi:S-adenosylmethionine:diacylglycerol 3-amino-3-carboxypropyl transferase